MAAAGQVAHPISLSRGRDIDALRLELATCHAAVLRSFLAADEREWVRGQLADAEFDPNPSHAMGKSELLMKPNAVSAFLLYKMCDPELFDLVEAVTGCEPIGSFRGRTYRMVPGGRFGRWHDDAVMGRLAAFTLNLSTEPFGGARLQVKDAEADELLTEIGDLEFGDAVLIQISPAYQHRNSPLLGTVPKTSHAGFFYPGEASPLVRR